MIARLLQRYRSRGVFVDSNILLLFFVGSFDRAQIARFKRTRQYTVADYDVLIAFLVKFDRMITTPAVLAEVNSLSGQLGEPAKGRYFAHFAAAIHLLEEHYLPSVEAARVPAFSKIGLTDAGIMRLVKGSYLVLTDDLRLHFILESAGIDSINFNHLRPI